MMSIPTITIDLSKSCAECGNGGAADSGICLTCTSRAITGRRMRSEIGKAVQARFFERRAGSAA